MFQIFFFFFWSEMGKHEVHFVHNKCVFQLSAPYALSLIQVLFYRTQKKRKKEKEKRRYSFLIFIYFITDFPENVSK